MIKIIASLLTSIILRMLQKLNALPLLPYFILTTALQNNVETEVEGDNNLPNITQLMYKIGPSEH